MEDEFIPAESIGVTDEPNSPICDELPAGDSAAMFEGKGTCYVNGQVYKNGDYVCGWNRRYQCRNGKWILISNSSCPGPNVFSSDK